MENIDSKKLHWTTCPHCLGQSRVVRPPSRKRRRKHRDALEHFANSDETGSAPAELTDNMDVCLPCVGTGLIASKSATKVNLNYPKIAIVGGGIGGSALAVACLHRGIPFTLYERDENFNARSQGYGLTLQQASKAIQGLGIFSLKKGTTSTKHIVHNSEGKIIGEWGLRKWIQGPVKENLKRKNIHISRQSLRLEVLKKLHESDSIKWNHKFLDFTEKADQTMTLEFESFRKIITEEADLIIGADGIRSSVRDMLIKNTKTPLQYLGCIVILGICPLESLKKINSELLDSATVFQTVNGHERIYVMPYDNENIMWQLSFPLSEDQAKNLSKKGSAEMKKEALRRLQWHPPIPEMLSASPEKYITGYPTYDRELFSPESLYNKGNVSIIGDAAHPMSPFKGQGANQALLDSLLLARMITERCGENSDWKKNGLREIVLNDFEKEMAERTASKVLGSRKAAEVLHTDAVLHTGDNPRGRGFAIK